MDQGLALQVGLVVFFVSVCLAVRTRRKVDRALRTMGLGVILTVIILVIPLKGNNLVSAFLTALQTGSLDATYDELFDKAAKAVQVNDSYILFLRAMCVLSPVLVGGIILTFFERAFHKLLYLLLRPFKNIYYLSELNAESYMLAISLKKRARLHQDNVLVVFCNGENCADEALKGKAREEGFVITSDCEYDCVHHSRRRQYYFEISKNMDLNLSGATKLICSLAKHKMNPKHVRIYLFSNQAEAEIILNSTDKQGFEVLVINEAVTIAYDLMFHKPLYEALEPSGSKKLSVLIVGCGNIGKEILKAVLWCGQMGDDYALCVKVIDKDAQRRRSVFLMECPEMTADNYDVEFITSDVHTAEFEGVLNERCRDCNYIAVSLGDDEANIKTSLYLRGYYLRTSEHVNNEPIIAAVVMEEIKSDCIKKMTAVNRERILEKGWQHSLEKSENYNIHAFGAYGDVYSYDFLINSEIEKLSLNVHTVYELAFSGGNATEQAIRDSYFLNEINKRSSRANAVHMKYKLFSLGFVMTQRGEAPKDDACTDAFIEKFSNQETICKLAKLEHLRWNAFQRSEGYRSATIEQALHYRPYNNGGHRHLRSKLHPCICDWETLDQVAETFDSNFKKYDWHFVEQIPQMIGVVQDDRINLGEAAYIISLR